MRKITELEKKQL